MIQDPAPRYAEFFAGGGMVRAGLGEDWTCVLANDIDPLKCATYRENWGGEDLIEGDVACLDPRLLFQPIDLYWASSPCQDFSLAGKGEGLAGKKSGVFSDWVALLSQAVSRGFGPRLIAFENVCGLLSRRGGADFSDVLSQIIRQGYRVGALEIDAEGFVPQSRPRLFVIAVRRDVMIPEALNFRDQQSPFQSKKIQKFIEAADVLIRQNWVWWALPSPPGRARPDLRSLIETGDDLAWHSPEETAFLLSIMSDLHRLKVSERRESADLDVGLLYKRGRPDKFGVIRQRAEVRFDGVAGCLRTPGGGSSRQTVLVVGQGQVRSRLLTIPEASRLMGLPETYRMPKRYNAAYQVAGDGVVVPIVRHLKHCLFEPLLAAKRVRDAA